MNINYRYIHYIFIRSSYCHFVTQTNSSLAISSCSYYNIPATIAVIIYRPELWTTAALARNQTFEPSLLDPRLKAVAAVIFCNHALLSDSMFWTKFQMTLKETTLKQCDITPYNKNDYGSSHYSL